VCDPRHDKEALEQITSRCDKLGTRLMISGTELIVSTGGHEPAAHR
jgi:hypothetical protein